MNAKFTSAIEREKKKGGKSGAMAPKKSRSWLSRSPIQIGNCEVALEAGNFTCESDPKGLLISVAQTTAKIKISVREELHIRNTGDAAARQALTNETEVEGRVSSSRADYTFVLVNPRDGSIHCTYYLQEVLKIYTKELPTMNYAANTGKQSMFLSRCVSNGKYSTLLLKSTSNACPEKVIAAITYQIIPLETHYAEIPLAAVSSVYQRKGIGCFLFMELRRRLQSVGIHTIYCWGDEESKGFWLRQGFSSIAEVDSKGRAPKLSIKANIRKALCFPGGSTLMVCHPEEEMSNVSLNSLEFCTPKSTHENPSSALNLFVGPVSTTMLDKALDLQSYHPKGPGRDGFPGENINCGSDKGLSQIQSGAEPAHFWGGKSSENRADARSAKIGVDVDTKSCSCSRENFKRVWEASVSSLKSKRVKGNHGICCESNSSWGLNSENGRLDPCWKGSLGTLKGKSLEEVNTSDALNSNSLVYKFTAEPAIVIRESPLSNEFQSKGECFIVMLMNIGDNAKKAQLTKVIELLGGSVTAEGSLSTHVVTGKVRTTLNFCSALCMGAWIVSSSWLKESFRQGRFVDESPHLLCDEEYAVKYGVELRTSISRAKAKPGALFQGYNICMATHVQPPIQTLSTIVRCAGGNVISGLVNVKQASKSIFIACEEDMEEVLLAAKKGILTFSSEWLINCIMRQELDVEAQQFAESLS